MNENISMSISYSQVDGIATDIRNGQHEVTPSLLKILQLVVDYRCLGGILDV